MPPGRRFRVVGKWLGRVFWALLLTGLLTQSSVPPRDRAERVRRFTREEEFDFLTWTLDAVGLKLADFSLGLSGYLSEEERRQTVLEFASLADQAAQIEGRLLEILANPSPSQPGEADPLRDQLASIRARQAGLQPVVESVLEEELAVVLEQVGLTAGGAAVPPVAFHITRLPLALIVSPREVIRQEADIQLDAHLSLEQQEEMERRVETVLDVSALVVPVGGVGTYPTMVQETGALSWTIETVAHEWTHNFLTLHPLGMNYETSPEARTMNETAASLVGTAIGRLVLERYYPELVPTPTTPAPPTAPNEPPAFDFRTEMHQTRVTVDGLLAEGRTAEAEAYMESRRRVFWEHGYLIRRLNQAYFAFYGAYADEPGGAAGEDPVGAAVRELWAQSPSPAAFLRRIAWMNDYADLLDALGRPQAGH
jgi:hypothetical protein